MGHITRLYFRDITNLSDARFAAAADAALVGFSFDPLSANFVNPAQMMEMRAWLSGPGIVGNFGLVAPDELNRHIAEYQLEAVEVGYDVYAGYAKSLHAQTIMRLKLSALDQAGIRHFDGDYLLLHADALFPNFTMAKANKQLLYLLEKACAETRCLLDIPAEATQLRSMVESLNPYGICLYGGREERPGVREFGALQEQLEVLED
jgi:phosphoribosylanthranilate isomerase